MEKEEKENNIQSKIKLTEEQMQAINDCCELIKSVGETVIELWEAVKRIFIEVYKEIKERLTRKVSVRTKAKRKGKRYVHNYKKFELWKLISRWKK